MGPQSLGSGIGGLPILVTRRCLSQKRDKNAEPAEIYIQYVKYLPGKPDQPAYRLCRLLLPRFIVTIGDASFAETKC